MPTSASASSRATRPSTQDCGKQGVSHEADGKACARRRLVMRTSHCRRAAEVDCVEVRSGGRSERRDLSRRSTKGGAAQDTCGAAQVARRARAAPPPTPPDTHRGNRLVPRQWGDPRGERLRPCGRQGRRGRRATRQPCAAGRRRRRRRVGAHNGSQHGVQGLRAGSASTRHGQLRAPMRARALAEGFSV